MYQNRLQDAIKQLTLVSALLSELIFHFNEVDAPNVNEELERYLDSAVFSALNNVALQSNSYKKQNPQVWTKKEIEEMPYLKDLKYRITKDGIHQFRYRRDGYNESFNSKDYNVAKNKARAFLLELKKTIRSEADLYRGKTIDFVFNAWIELKKAHTDKLTCRVYENVYKNHILPVFGSYSVKTLLPLHLQPFFNELFAKHGKTCENAKIILNGIFKYAVANRLCPTNPMEGVLIQKHVRVPGKALSDEQILRFKSKMPGQGKFGLAGLIILYSGIRGFELQSLTFDWENGTFTVNNAKLKRSQKVNPENLTRTVPIFPGLYKLRSRIESEEWKIDPRPLSNDFKLYWSENTVKDLRHTFSSKAREAGVDNELVNIWMGHAPGKNLTANTYTHFSMNFQKAQAKRIDNY